MLKDMQSLLLRALQQPEPRGFLQTELERAETDLTRITGNHRQMPGDPQRQAQVQQTRHQKAQEALRGSPHQPDAVPCLSAARKTRATCSAARPVPS